MTSAEYVPWSPEDAAAMIAVPTKADDKYSRGVLGMITGSTMYPGAAVLGVEAALHTGVGMVRYLGPERPADLVLARRPEVVTADGRVQAWLIGSGIDQVEGNECEGAMRSAIAQGVPVVLDGGALSLARQAAGPVVVTPHYRELAKLTGGDAAAIADAPGDAALDAARSLNVTVLLKGNTTFVASPDGTVLSTSDAPTWLATAGSGDALGGILGALVATHADAIPKNSALLAKLAATASVLHALAADRASAGGPFTVLDLAGNVSQAIAALLARS